MSGVKIDPVCSYLCIDVVSMLIVARAKSGDRS